MVIAQRTERLALEPLEVRHADALYEALKDPAVHAFIETSGRWTQENVRGRLERLAQGPPEGSDDVWLNYVVLLDHLRSDHEVTEVWATVDPRNAASIRLLERCGFDPREAVPAEVGSYDEGDAVYRLELG